MRQQRGAFVESVPVRLLDRTCDSSMKSTASFRKLRFEDRPQPVLTLDYLVGGRSLSVFTTIATLGTPQDVTLQEVRIECFFPADDRSDALFRSLAAQR